MDKAEREALAKRLLSFSHAEETEVLISRSRSALTRFTHQSVHQNVAAERTTIRVRAVVDNRCGVASTTASDETALRDVVERAIRIAGWAPRDEQWPGLPRGGVPEPAPTNGFAPVTAEATADQRAEIADAIFAVSEKHDLWSAGFVATSADAITIANSHGRLCSHEGTEALAIVKQNGADATGYGEGSFPSLAAINGEAIASVAAQKASATAHPRPVEPGTWSVILEPVAFGELLSYLTGHFSVQAVEEGSSFLSWASLGQPQVDRSITMRDDWADPLAPGMPFDYEGTPRERLALFREGTAESLVTDSRWAARLGRPNTGHALPAPNRSGPQPLNVVVDPGTASLESLISGTERGLLISRFWYIRPVDEHQSIVTGMTRDGTFLIEKGKLVGGVQNLRFNQSIVAALKHVTLSDTPVRTTGLDYTMVVPAAKIEAFSFSSSTSF